jgi:hypothetical protein
MIASGAEITRNNGYAIAILDGVTFNRTKRHKRSLQFKELLKLEA